MAEESGSVKGKRLAIIGFANSKEDVPFTTGGFDHVWALNELWAWFDKKPERWWSHWFEMHGPQDIGTTKRVDTPDQKLHWEWMAKQTKPIYMQAKHPDVPASVRFPLEELDRRLKGRMPFFDRYWASSIGQMLGLAICAGRNDRFEPGPSGNHYDYIALYGIDLAGDSEYNFQRPNAELLAGFAAGIGIELSCHPDSALFRGECVYGYEQPPDMYGPLNRRYLEKHVKEIEAEIAKHNEQMAKETAIVNTLSGALQETRNSLALLNFAKRGVGQANLSRVPVRAEVVSS